jgi:hypothetical protein
MVTALALNCSRKASVKPPTIRLDYAYYNPVSLVLKDKKFLEQDLASAKYLEILVSAAGFEPATHALKGEHFKVLPRGFNHLRSARPLQIGAKAPQSALNLQLNLQ